jgi:EmrB/QacA subfamily drug resistance transporter
MASDTHRRRWAILAVLCVSVLLVTVDNTIVNVALPSIGRQLRASTGTLQWVVDAYSLVFAGLLLVGGNLADRLGRRLVLQAGLAAFVATSLGAAVAASSAQLITARAAMGVAAALVYPSTLALLSNVFTDPRERATAIGIWAGVSGLAVAVGPLAGGVLLDHFGWNSVFFFTAALGSVALVLNRIELPESVDPAPGRFDPLGALMSVTAMTALVYTVIEAPARGWRSTTTLAGFAASLAVVAGFVAWESHRPSPLLDVSLFTNARFSTGAAAIALAFFGLFGFIFLITLYFQAIRGYSPLRAGIATVPFAAITGAMSPVAIVLMKRFGTKCIVASGLAMMSAGFVVAATITTTSGYWGRIIISMALMAAGLALTSGPASEAVVGAVPAAKTGAGSAVNDTTRELGGALGVAVIGSVFASRYAPDVSASLARLGLHGPAVNSARGSLIAGLASAARLPVGLRTPATDAVHHAFMAGMSAGSLAAAGVTALAALTAAICLPAQATSAQTGDQASAARLERVPTPAA